MRASAPGKLILSGEHAVVYSAPALLTAVSLRTYCEIERTGSDALLFQYHNQDLNLNFSCSRSELNVLLDSTLSRFRQFQNSEIPISSVISDRNFYPLIVVAVFLSRLGIADVPAVKFKINSEIPFGAGLGSSSALTLAIISALDSFYQKNLTAFQVLELCREAESLHTGRPSGADLAAIYNGGTGRFKNGKLEKVEELKFPDFIYFHTGIPESSTGEAVMQVAKNFSGDFKLWEDFAMTEKLFEGALVLGDYVKLSSAIRQNHYLLTQIGVVPLRVQNFIAAIEESGGAAKVCGAGAVKGDKAGIVMAYGDALTDIAKEYGYSFLEFKLGESGVRID